ncbi:hypothetical protein, partial [Pseudomonas khavaziana]|uniref:hypothetical protein n=1 Tax=Pseudomonas khavaziana TaxID=2842351 RepID=UPI001C3D720E
NGTVIDVIQVPVEPKNPTGPTKPGYVKPGTTLPVDPKQSRFGAGPNLSYLYRDAQKFAVEEVGSYIEFVNSEHIAVDRNGIPKVSRQVRAIDGSPVYVKDDGTFTTDVHGGRLPSGVLLMNNRGIVVDEKGHPFETPK